MIGIMSDAPVVEASPVDAAWLKQRLGATQLRRLPAGASLFARGEATFAMFVLDAGRLRLRRDGADGQEVVLQTVLPGETFAEAALVAPAYHCDAVADVPSVVAVLPRDRMRALLETDHVLALALVRLLAHQLQQARARAELRAIKGARERVLASLALAAGEGGWITLRGTLKDLAGELALTPEALYRTLASLEREGALRRLGGRIKLS